LLALEIALRLTRFSRIPDDALRRPTRALAAAVGSGGGHRHGIFFGARRRKLAWATTPSSVG
jgi:hypothetical protein